MSGNRFADAGEEMLDQMRRMNAANALKAMDDLQHGSFLRGSLPPVRTHKAKAAVSENAAVRTRKRVRPRSETPKEIRGAAERELFDSEKKSGRKERLREAVQAQQSQSDVDPSVVRKLFATSSSEGERFSGEAKEEQSLLLQLLDLQSQSKLSSPSFRDFFAGMKGPEVLFDQELRSTSHFLKMHNQLIGDYLKSSKSSILDNGAGDDAAKDSQFSGHSSYPRPASDHTTRADDTPEPQDGLSVESAPMSLLGTGKTRRWRKEMQLKQLLEEAKLLRQRALNVVGRGGLEMVDQGGQTRGLWASDGEVENKLKPIGRSVLLVLNTILRSSISEGQDSVIGADGATDGLQEVAHMRQMLDVMRQRALSEGPALRAASAKRRRRMDELRKRKAWQGRVEAQSSISSLESLSELDERKEQERAAGTRGSEHTVKFTMNVLHQSGGWFGQGAHETEMEVRLKEMQEKNLRLHNAARHNLQTLRDPRRGDKVNVGTDLVGGKHGAKKARKRKPANSGAYGGHMSVYTWSVDDGYHAEAEYSGVSDPEADFDDNEDGKPSAAENMQKARASRAAPVSDVAWLDDLLPSATEVSDVEDRDKSFDASFWNSPVTKQVVTSLVNFESAQRSKQADLIKRSLQVQQLQEQVGKAHASADNISVVQERVMQQVSRIRRDITQSVRAIFQHISDGRKKIVQAQGLEDFELARIMTQEAQMLLAEAEIETINLRQRVQSQQSINLNLMPDYLKEFVLLSDTAQSLFDKARITALQEKSLREDQIERRAQEAYELELKMHGKEPFDDPTDLTMEEELLLHEIINESKELVALLRTSYTKSEETKQLQGDPVQAAAHAEAATMALERAFLLAKQVRKKMSRPRARRLKKHYPLHLKNLKDCMSVPLCDLWRNGKIVPDVCEAIPALDIINERLLEAKRILSKLDEGDSLTEPEESKARDLLESSILDAVAVREKARAAMLDLQLGGEEVFIWQFPRHVQNLIATDESVIVLWEKGLTEEQICEWVQEVEAICELLRTSLKLDQKAAEAGMTAEGLELLAKVDKLQFEADRRFEALRKTIRIAIRKGLMLGRLPPHLQNVATDGRRLMTLFREGRTDAVQALLIHHAVLLLRRHGMADEAKKRAQRLMDEENKREAFLGAEAESLSALKEMLRMRAKFIVSGLDPSANIPKEVQDALDLAEGMSGSALSREVLAELGREMGASAALLERVARFQRTKTNKEQTIMRVNWAELVGKCACDLEPLDDAVVFGGIDTTPVFKQVPELGYFTRSLPANASSQGGLPEAQGPDGGAVPDDSIRLSGAPVETSMPMAMDGSRWTTVDPLWGASSFGQDEVRPGWSNLPVFDDPHPISLDQTDMVGQDLTSDEGLRGNDTDEWEPGQGQQVAPAAPRRFDDSDEEEADRLGRKKAVKVNAKSRLEGNQQKKGIPLDIRKRILDIVFDSKRTLKIDISNLDLPYIPKQVYDSLHINALIADHNALDYIDPALGRMFNLKLLSLSWNRIEAPFPENFWHLINLRTLNLDHNQIDEIPKQIQQLSSMTRLRLDANNLCLIPPELGIRTNLKYLALDRNFLKDLPIEMKRMGKLFTLTLSRNEFSHIPDCVYYLASLKVLHLNHNKLPSFPPQLANLKTLTELNMGANLLTELPPALSIMVTLRKFDVSRNEIRAMGPEIGCLTALHDLSLAHNHLVQIPEVVDRLILLKKLKVDSNRLTFLPLDLTQLTVLELLDIRNNLFIALAPQLGRVTSLTEIKVLGNPMKTPAPFVCDAGTEIMLQYLQRLDAAIASGEMDLHDLRIPRRKILVEKGDVTTPRFGKKKKDKFSFLPEIICPLREFHFPHGWYTGQFLLKRENITSLDLSGHGMKYLLGPEFSGNREKCVVPHGMVDGKAPPDGWVLDPLSRLGRLQLQDNRLSELPAEFEHLVALKYLDLMNNSLERLSGPHFGKLVNLTYLNLRNNVRLKRLPFEMGKFDQLIWLDVVDCTITSPPPVIVQRGVKPIVDYLRRHFESVSSKVLDLDGLLLMSVPHDVTEGFFLTSAYLRNNAICQLPQAIGDMVELRTLRLDYNRLSVLPSAITKLKNLSEFGLSYNLFSEVFQLPEMFLAFKGLRLLDVSHNVVISVPHTLCELEELSDLRLNHNRLKTVPFEMYRLTNLTNLDLRCNVLRLPLKDIAESEDIGTLLELLRTFVNARGDKHPKYFIRESNWLDLSYRPYKLLFEEVVSISNLQVLKLVGYGMENMSPYISALGKLKILELQENKLNCLPDTMLALTGLVRLSLSRNYLPRIPYCLSALTSLRELHLDDNFLTVIFADIKNLVSLTELNVSRNSLRQVTPSLQVLSNLRVLDLSSNQLSHLPKELSRLSNVQRLSVRENYITELPTEFHELSDGSLVVFDVELNGLKSPPPEIVRRGNDAIFQYLTVVHRAKSSATLNLSDMGLTYLPGEVMRFYRTEGIECRGLKTLILDGNDISWLPSYMRVMTTLTHISLRRCRFSKLPYFLGDFRDLSVLDIEGNDIVVPSSEILRRGVEAIKKYMRNLDQAWWTKELDMSGQRWESVPVEICDVDSLTSLRLQNQPFCNIPPEIGRISALTHLNLQYCSLVELPESVGGLFNLRELLVNNNRLLALPRGIGACTALTDLRAHENALEDLPPEIGNLQHMMDLRLFNNNLLQVPMEIGHMRYLPAFRISSNQLPAITIGIGGLESVSDLLIADNLLEALPREIGLLTCITRLRATNNRLRALPPELRNLHAMTELAVSNNRLTELPLLGDLTSLRNLVVAENPLRMPPEAVLRRGTFAVINYLRVLEDAGGAPIEVVTRGEEALAVFHEAVASGRAAGALSLRARMLVAVPRDVLEATGLTSLDLDVNILQDLPPELCRLTGLRAARASYNQLHSLPSSLAALTNLTTLELKYNFLTAFPECVCGLPLRSLFLDSNEIQELPAAAAGLTALAELSLANNALRRVSPAAPAGLGALATLWLQQNELFQLPDTVGLLTGLTRVDLSFNHLAQLPAAAAGLTAVTDLRLAYNELRAGALPVEGMPGLTALTLAANRLAGVPHTLARLSLLRLLTLGGNDFAVEPQHQRLTTWETAQRWLKANLDAWAAAQALKAKQGPAWRKG